MRPTRNCARNARAWSICSPSELAWCVRGRGGFGRPSCFWRGDICTRHRVSGTSSQRLSTAEGPVKLGFSAFPPPGGSMIKRFRRPARRRTTFSCLPKRKWPKRGASCIRRPARSTPGGDSGDGSLRIALALIEPRSRKRGRGWGEGTVPPPRLAPPEPSPAWIRAILGAHPFGASFAVPQALQRLQVGTLSRRERDSPGRVAGPSCIEPFLIEPLSLWERGWGEGADGESATPGQFADGDLHGGFLGAWRRLCGLTSGEGQARRQPVLRGRAVT